jgi:hypothetical protein
VGFAGFPGFDAANSNALSALRPGQRNQIHDLFQFTLHFAHQQLLLRKATKATKDALNHALVITNRQT